MLENEFTILNYGFWVPISLVLKNHFRLKRGRQSLSTKFHPIKCDLTETCFEMCSIRLFRYTSWRYLRVCSIELCRSSESRRFTCRRLFLVVAKHRKENFGRFSNRKFKFPPHVYINFHEFSHASVCRGRTALFHCPICLFNELEFPPKHTYTYTYIFTYTHT